MGRTSPYSASHGAPLEFNDSSLSRRPKRAQNISITLCFGAFATILGAAAPPDIQAIMQRSLAAVEKNGQAAHGYIFLSRVEKHELDSSGHVKSTDAKSYDTVAVDGIFLQKWVAHNDRPLTVEEERQESSRVRRLINERRDETPPQKLKRLSELDRQRAKEIAFNRELLTAFDFKIAGEERIDGRDAWRIEATPRAGYQPHEMRSQMLPHFKGTVWVDREDYCWLKVDAEAADAVTIGLFLVRMEKGAHIVFSQFRFEDGVWLPRASVVKAIIHVGLFKKINFDQTITFSQHRKLPPNANVITARPEER